MWPWEHAAFGYLLYSLLRRGNGLGPPADTAAVVVVVAAVMPDLVDKPLSWGFGLFPAGYSIAHSAFVAVPVGLAVLAGTRRTEHVHVGVAFVVGYWSHLVGDILYPFFLGDGLGVERVLWPVATLPAYESQLGMVERTLRYVAEYGEAALAGEIGGLILLEATFLLVALVLWVADGLPGPAGIWRALRADRR